MTVGLSRTVPEIIGDFCRKSQVFPIPMYLTPLLREFPLEFCTGNSAPKTIVMPLPNGEIVLRYFYIRFDTIPECDGDGRTDGRTDLSYQYRALRA